MNENSSYLPVTSRGSPENILDMQAIENVVTKILLEKFENNRIEPLEGYQNKPNELSELKRKFKETEEQLTNANKELLEENERLKKKLSETEDKLKYSNEPLLSVDESGNYMLKSDYNSLFSTFCTNNTDKRKKFISLYFKIIDIFEKESFDNPETTELLKKEKDTGTQEEKQIFTWIFCLCFIKFKTNYENINKCLSKAAYAHFRSTVFTNNMFLLRHMAQKAKAKGMIEFLDTLIYKLYCDSVSPQKKRKILHATSSPKKIVVQNTEIENEIV